MDTSKQKKILKRKPKSQIPRLEGGEVAKGAFMEDLL